jgi:hypothetical protein
MICKLTAVFYTVLWLSGWNQTVKVCEYRCPKEFSERLYNNPYKEWVHLEDSCRSSVKIRKE